MDDGEFQVDLHKDDIVFMRLIEKHELPAVITSYLNRRTAITLALLFEFHFVYCDEHTHRLALTYNGAVYLERWLASNEL